MKITSLKAVVVNAEMRNWVFCKVETDQAGLYGWGEGSLEWKTPGLGIEVDEARAKEHPFQQEVMHSLTARAADNAILDW